ncbi:hypothetical protein [Paenibacillus xylanexedens]|uniref:hypothetical protein n=1 Tax=Paenibacillus xylanexedens TaxID=528191 RepID=UPI000F529F81|nr:hypothetical protein [Paenibacillus xylanexedens]
MKNLLKKSLNSLGITAILLGTMSSVSFASISWDSSATWFGSGARANVSAVTRQDNEPYNYQISVSARTNDGSNGYNVKNPAKSTDTVSINFLTGGAVSSGTSTHEWVMVGESGSVSKTINFN